MQRYLRDRRVLAAAVGPGLGYVDDARSSFRALVGWLHWAACVSGWLGFVGVGLGVGIAEGGC